MPVLLLYAAQFFGVQEAALRLSCQRNAGVVGGGGVVGVEHDEGSDVLLEARDGAVFFVGDAIDGHAPAFAAVVFAGGSDAGELLGVGWPRVVLRRRRAKEWQVEGWKS